MAYQKILDQKQSTYGSPYCIYTVEVQPSSRTENSVKLKVKVTSHLKYSDSYLHDGSYPDDVSAQQKNPAAHNLPEVQFYAVHIPYPVSIPSSRLFLCKHL